MFRVALDTRVRCQACDLAILEVREADAIFVAHSANCGNSTDTNTRAVENGGIKTFSRNGGLPQRSAVRLA